MSVTPAEGTAFEEVIVFLRHFEDLEDPRQRSRVQYPIAVGTRLTTRPPHRTGRARLRHPAPTLSV